MRIGITMEDQQGLEGQVSLHFGQSPYFLLVDVENGKIKDTQVVRNENVHGGGGCVAVDGMLMYGVTHVISGGMGMGAQQKFANAGVVVSGYQGKASEAVNHLLSNSLSGLSACRNHGSHSH
jgi:predicted Fe-Mo cluster-binding NifX family protein